jgi:hypothetical protein
MAGSVGACICPATLTWIPSQFGLLYVAVQFMPGLPSRQMFSFWIARRDPGEIKKSDYHREPGSLLGVSSRYLETRRKREMRILQSIFKPILLSIVAIAAITFSHGVAKAGEVTISGSTSGIVTGFPPLTFAGSTFTGTTLFGTGALSGSSNLGMFTLALSPAAMVPPGTIFNLAITFTQPAGITNPGGQGQTFTANITGNVSPNLNVGGLDVTFNQPAGGTLFSFSNGTPAGTGFFFLTLDPTHVQSGQNADLTAGIRGSTVPEPTSMLLLGIGLIGFAGVARRRFSRRS